MRAVAILAFVVLAQFDSDFWRLREAIGPEDHPFNDAGKYITQHQEHEELEQRLERLEKEIHDGQREDSPVR